MIDIRPTDVPEPPPSVLPPGSICEQCFDQPATQLLPAPWGGEMGVCIWCAAGKGDESEIEESELFAQLLLDDAISQRSSYHPLLGQYFDMLLRINHVTLPSGVHYEYASRVGEWHQNITDCPDGVRYIRQKSDLVF